MKYSKKPRSLWNYLTSDQFQANTWGAILFIAIGIAGIIYYTLKGY